MNYQKVLIMIFVVSLVMYAMRVLPLVFFNGKIKNQFLQTFLAYIPYAVLTSMLIPEVFRSTSNLFSAIVGVITAVILSFVGQDLLVVALSSTAVVFVVEQIMAVLKI